MDGVNGHPIKLVPCSDDGTPARAASCATQVLQSNPIGIIGGADFATSSSVPLFTAAGKPYIGGVAFSGPENPSSLSFQWNNTTAIGAALIPYAIQTLHVKEIVGLYPTGNGSALEADELSKEIADAVKGMLGRLDDRERLIIISRYGINGASEETLLEAQVVRRTAGLLPRYDECLAFYASLGNPR